MKKKAFQNEITSGKRESVFYLRRARVKLVLSLFSMRTEHMCDRRWAHVEPCINVYRAVAELVSNPRSVRKTDKWFSVYSSINYSLA